MAELEIQTPLAGTLPVTTGPFTLEEVPLTCVTALAPWPGAEGNFSKALEARHGLKFPAPNRSTTGDGLRCLWSGRAQAFLIGDRPADPELAQHGALTDISDGWAMLRLSGERPEEVLARLTPLDLSPGVFKRGHTARSELFHIPALFTRVPRGIEIMVMRSFAGTAAHDLQEAMSGVAARRAL